MFGEKKKDLKIYDLQGRQTKQLSKIIETLDCRDFRHTASGIVPVWPLLLGPNATKEEDITFCNHHI